MRAVISTIIADPRADGCRRIPINGNVSGISASPAAAAWRSTLLRPTVSAGFFNLTLDPDHGKDDHRSLCFAGDNVDG
jgi:hypothetical protein